MSNQQPPSGDIPLPFPGTVVDLDEPCTKLLRNFGAQLAQRKPRAVVVMALTENGEVTAASHTPGGRIEMLGLVEDARLLLYAQMMAQNNQPRAPMS